MNAVLAAGIDQIEPYIAITVAAAGLVTVWLCFLLWGWLSGQFEDAESAKHRVFEDDVPSAGYGDDIVHSASVAGMSEMPAEPRVPTPSNRAHDHPLPSQGRGPGG
jgi:cbb3-type cytochrome oxidase maturation protein